MEEESEGEVDFSEEEEEGEDQEGSDEDPLRLERSMSPDSTVVTGFGDGSDDDSFARKRDGCYSVVGNVLY